MPRIGIRSADGLSWDTTRATADAIHAVYPGLTLGGTVVEAGSLAGWPRLKIIEDVAPPATAWGQSAVEDMNGEEYTPGKWRQKWTVTSITLAEAKSMLAQMAIDIYQRKVDAPFTAAEMTASAGSYSAIKAAREATYKPLVATARTQIQAAATIADAYAIYQTLEAVP